MQLSSASTPTDGPTQADRLLGPLDCSGPRPTKPPPVFSLNRRCNAAIRRIATFVDLRVDAEKARIAVEFQALRRAHGLPSISDGEQETPL